MIFSGSIETSGSKDQLTGAKDATQPTRRLSRFEFVAASPPSVQSSLILTRFHLGELMLSTIGVRLVLALASALAFTASSFGLEGDRVLPAFLSKGRPLKVVGLVNPFGYGIAQDGHYLREPFSAGWPSIAEAVPSAFLVHLKEAGFNAVRLVVDPAPLLLETNEPEFKRLLGLVVDGVAYIVHSGLRCIVDIHPSLTPMVHGYGAKDLLDGPGPKFGRLMNVEAQLAAELANRFSAAAVALELYNEPPRNSFLFGARSWSMHLKQLYGSVRRAAPELTLVLSGDDYGSVDGLIALDPGAFDENTVYSFHDYHPMVFTHQAVRDPAVGFGIQYVHRLAFPPDPAAKSLAIKDAMNRVSADINLSKSQRADLSKKLTRVLNAYFEGPQDLNWIEARVKKAVRWAASHGIQTDRIFWGEFGVWGDINGIQGADMQSRANYLATVRKLAESLEIGWGVWELTNPNTAWSISAQSGESRTIDDTLKAALFQ